jgi:hypothetical protein
LILGRVEKSLFFDVVLGLPKFDKNRALGRQGAAKCATIRRWSGDFWDRGPRGASRAELLNIKITGRWCIILHADGEWPGEFFCLFLVLAKKGQTHQTNSDFFGEKARHYDQLGSAGQRLKIQAA